MMAVTDPGFGQGGRDPSSNPPEKCVIWASEYNLGPQKWGAEGPGPPWIRYWMVRPNGRQLACTSKNSI